MNLCDYLVIYWGIYNSVVTYMLKIKNFCKLQANLPPNMAFLSTYSHDEMAQMAWFVLQRTHYTIQVIFKFGIGDLGEIISRYLQKSRFSLCFPYISYSKTPRNTKVVLYFFCATTPAEIFCIFTPEHLGELQKKIWDWSMNFFLKWMLWALRIWPYYSN